MTVHTYLTYTYYDHERKVGRSSVPLVNPDNPTLEEVRTLLAELGLPDLDRSTTLYRWGAVPTGRPAYIRYHALGFDVHLGYQTLPNPTDKEN